jgi:hypothetical protein
MQADPRTCEHKYLVEVRNLSGTIQISFDRETNETEDTIDSGRTIGKPRKWCHCENCGKRFLNPRYPH